MNKLLLRLKKFLKLFSLSDNFLHYIGNSESLPTPFTPEEEQVMLDRLKDGEEAIKGELIEHNLRLVVYIARKFENTGVDLEDLISVGTIGLIKAINSFNTDKNCYVRIALYRKRNFNAPKKNG